MALLSCGRLGSKPLLASIGRLPTMLGSAQYAQGAMGVPKVTFKKYEPLKDEHFELRNERLKRPLSPYLYSVVTYPKLTSTLSITHRITGMALTGYFTALGVGALLLPHDISHYISLYEALNLSAPCLFMIKTVLAAPFGYHFANGLRHLYWDTAKGLSMKEVYTTGYTMLGVAAVITLVLAAL